MLKPNEIILKETAFVMVVVILLSVFLQVVFLFLGIWSYTVILGNILSATVATANFFFLGISLQIASSKKDVVAKNTIIQSQSIRTLFLFAITALGVALPYFNTITVIMPLFFPRIAMFLRPLWKSGNLKEAIKNE